MNKLFPALLTMLLIPASVGMIGFIFVSDVAYAPVVIWHIFYLDPILFSAAAGMFFYIYSQKFYQWMKARNGGHAIPRLRKSFCRLRC